MWKPWRYKGIYDHDGTLYLERYGLMLPGGWALMLHVIHRPDADRCHHDHPWKFWTLVLRHGYIEQVRYPGVYTVREVRELKRLGAVHQTDGSWLATRRNRPGMLLFRPAKFTHRIAALPRGKAVTLVLRGPETRTWGFWNATGRWINSRAFWNMGKATSVLWCGTQEEPKE